MSHDIQHKSESQLIPVTRIELLSSANKPPGSHHDSYIAKRDETLRGQNQTYAANPYYGMVLVDYEKEPIRMETYAPDDQARIRAWMAAIQAESANSP